MKKNLFFALAFLSFLMPSCSNLWLGDRNEYLFGITQCNYNSDEGDSGGIVYTSSGGNILGIHAGGSSSTTYFIPASSINSAFNLSMY